MVIFIRFSKAKKYIITGIIIIIFGFIIYYWNNIKATVEIVG